ncbi:hypothetical protein ACWGKS_28535, partial [Nocardiopsis sp. NPDC055879]
MTNNVQGSSGVVVQMRDMHGGDLHIHNAPAPRPVVPRQLPAPRLFLDRDQARAWLDRAWRARHGPMRVAVQGPSGIGKTALVTAWGHEHRHRWPDGALYTSLSTTDPDTALRGWLLALGHTYLPDDSGGLGALWRTATAHRRLLVVVEQATAEAVHALFPAGSQCAGIATAHHGLEELVATGGRIAHLAGLPDQAVGDLINHLIDRPVPVQVLDNAVASANGSPLAATLTAAALASNLYTPLAETEQEHLVPDRITMILTNLPEQTATVAVLIAASPGSFVTAESTAALMEAPREQAQHTLTTLVEAALLVDLGRGRYTVHDQVRQPLADKLTCDQHTAMVEALAGFYRVRLAAVDLVLNVWRWRADTEGVELARATQEDKVWFSTRDEALAWADAELDNIIALARLLHRLDRPEVAMFVDHIGTYVTLRKPPIARELYEWGLEVARPTGDGRLVGLMLQRLSTSLHPDWQAALDLNLQAKDAYEQAAFPQGVASAYESIGSMLARLGRLEEAEEAQTVSLRLHQELGRPRGAAFQTRRLGEIHVRQGRTQEAMAAFTASHRTLLHLDPPDIYQATRNTQGMIALLLNEEAPALLPVAELLALEGLASTLVSGSLHQRASLYMELATITRI